MITDAKNAPLSQQNTRIPNISNALRSWFKPMIFTKIIKSVNENTGIVEEIENQIIFQGVIQPLGLKDLEVKPEGQRSWQWYSIHALTNLRLNLDDKIIYLGQRYRVMKQNSYDEYGYVEYHVIKDFENG